VVVVQAREADMPVAGGGDAEFEVVHVGEPSGDIDPLDVAVVITSHLHAGGTVVTVLR
jgi:hypothetical protein